MFHLLFMYKLANSLNYGFTHIIKDVRGSFYDDIFMASKRKLLVLALHT